MDGYELAKLPELLGCPMSGESRELSLAFHHFSARQRYASPVGRSRSGSYMGKLLIRCAKLPGVAAPQKR
jgi:hypothetical protein